MANTRQAAKRALQSDKKFARNQKTRTITKNILRNALNVTLSTKDKSEALAQYNLAIKALGKAGTKGALPKGRVSRKISRLTRLLKKTHPDALPSVK